jgi:arsenate reductase
MNRKGRETFSAFSAGSHPAGTVRAEAIRQVEKAGLNGSGARSKSWAEFSRPDSPHLNFVFTVCDNAANEVCPIWPGPPITAHWGVPDPAAVQGSPAEIERAYSQAFQALDRRISLFLALPIASIDSFALQAKLNEIGKS